MNALNNIRMGAKLIGGYIFIALIIVVVAIVSYTQMNLMNTNMTSMYNDRLVPSIDIGNMMEGLYATRGDVYKYMLLTDANERASAKTDMEAKIKLVDDAVAHYETTNLTTDEEKIFKQVSANWAEYRAAAQEVIKWADSGNEQDKQSAMDSLTLGRASTSRKAVSDSMDQLSAINDTIAQDLKKQADAAFSSARNMLIIATLVGIGLALLLGIILSNSITGPLQKGVVMMQEMSLGHIGNRLKMERRDEIGILASSMDVFANDLQNIVVATLKKVADGDLSTEVSKKDERDEISPALIQITTSLRGLVSEAGMLTRAGVEGRLSTRGDASKFKGGYHEIVQGVNNTLDAVIGPLNVAAAYVDKIAGGVIPAPITDSYNGDFNNLKNNLNRMSDRLREMLTGISDAANNLSSATAEILAATTQQASGASEQSAAISQTTTTVEEVKASTEQASMRAQDVATASQKTVEVARSGQTSVQATIESMGMIKEKVEGISENLLALSDQTQQIGEIIATVNEIASQSNMLALNASVEAARAGEHGKGFAVVATEVRSLAEQSRQATEQIKAILSEIQKATNSTVMATEEGVKGVDRGVQLSSQSRESIEQLAAVINESAQVAAQVVASGQQQQTGIDQISLAMQNINQVTMQSLASTRQTEKSAQNLTELARKMSEILAQYRF